MRKTVACVCVVLFLLSTAMLFSAGQRERMDNRLVLYASHPTEMIDYFVGEFQKEHDIEVELITGGTGELLSRIEAESGNPQADIMWGGGSHTGGQAPQLFVPYESDRLNEISEELHDPAGYNAPFDAFTMVIVYNKDLVSEDEVPRTWAELADPKWHRKIVHANPSASSSAYAAMVTWKEIGGWDFVEDLAKNQIIAESSSAPFTQVGQGENPLGVAYEEGAWRWMPTGRIGIVYPEDGVALLPGGMFIVRGGPNPDNAKAFVDFVLSKEQQEALGSEFPGRRPAHKDAELSGGMPRVRDLNVIEYPGVEAAEMASEWMSTWREIMERTR